MAAVQRTHCKYGCGHTVTPGTTKRGNTFDTCCRECVRSKGGKHDYHCTKRNNNGSQSQRSLARTVQTKHKWELRRSKAVHGSKQMILYHVTNQAGADGIGQKKQMIRGGSGKFGGGVYFAESEQIAKSKALYKGYVIKANVLVGTELQVQTTGNYTFRELWKKGYDSVWAPTYSERVIYNYDQVEILSITKY
mmetsp:Transcript_42879/g.68804  ORF Transcript_42879/g.68804 Transcript_42879/m.68804 type:complete len:193 (-) Transcript_42879:41-619(-)